jgi:hypothetical protein
MATSDFLGGGVYPAPSGTAVFLGGGRPGPPEGGGEPDPPGIQEEAALCEAEAIKSYAGRRYGDLNERDAPPAPKIQFFLF